MAAEQKLSGIELIDCARASASLGEATAARLCGYGHDCQGFMAALKQACADIGVKCEHLTDLVEDSIGAKTAPAPKIGG